MDSLSFFMKIEPWRAHTEWLGTGGCTQKAQPVSVLGVYMFGSLIIKI